MSEAPSVEALAGAGGSDEPGGNSAQAAPEVAPPANVDAVDVVQAFLARATEGGGAALEARVAELVRAVAARWGPVTELRDCSSGMDQLVVIMRRPHDVDLVVKAPRNPASAHLVTNEVFGCRACAAVRASGAHCPAPTVLESSDDPSTPYIVQTCVPGVRVCDAWMAGSLTPAHQAAVLTDLGRVMRAMHSAPVTGFGFVFDLVAAAAAAAAATTAVDAADDAAGGAGGKASASEAKAEAAKADAAAAAAYAAAADLDGSAATFREVLAYVVARHVEKAARMAAGKPAAEAAADDADGSAGGGGGSASGAAGAGAGSAGGAGAEAATVDTAGDPLGQLGRLLESHGTLLAAEAAAYRRFAAACRSGRVLERLETPAVVHRDLDMDNMLMTPVAVPAGEDEGEAGVSAAASEVKITGLVDFGDLTLLPALYDLASIQSRLFPFSPPDLFQHVLNGYCEADAATPDVSGGGSAAPSSSDAAVGASGTATGTTAASTTSGGYWLTAEVAAARWPSLDLLALHLCTVLDLSMRALRRTWRERDPSEQLAVVKAILSLY